MTLKTHYGLGSGVQSIRVYGFPVDPWAGIITALDVIDEKTLMIISHLDKLSSFFLTNIEIKFEIEGRNNT